MPNMEKVMTWLEICGKNRDCSATCPYGDGSGEDEDSRCREDLMADAFALLKEQITTSTNESRIFHCKKCGYGIDDIFLSDEHNYQIEPCFCPNCGRLVKRE